EQMLAVAAPQLDDVAEAAGRDQAGVRAAVLQHRVRDDSRPEHDHFGLTQKTLEVQVVLAGGLAEPIHDALRLVSWGRRAFRLEDLAGRVTQDEVGEGPTDVDPDLERHADPPCVARGRRARRAYTSAATG